MGVRFGTDGIRGLANVEVTPELALAVGRAAARHLPSETFLVGRDTRRSGPMLLGALAAGLASEGGMVHDLGVIPTPGLAYLASERRHPAGMISASHNPFYDNGIKLFSSTGSKLPDALERSIEEEIDRVLGLAGAASGPGEPTGASVGEIVADRTGLDAYVEYLVRTVDLSGGRRLRVVCDSANGAASTVAAAVFGRLGVDVELIGIAPDGTNINDGYGSTDTAALARAVKSSAADLGIAFDGDADRCLAIDDEGAPLDGDVLISLFALDHASRSELLGGGVVVTVMSNLGLHRALAAAGIEVVQVAVGDRNILEALELRGLALGGEQSGHIIFRNLATTGDGLLTALKLIELCARSNAPLSAMAGGAMTRLPQELRTVRIPEPGRWSSNEAVLAAIAAVEERLAGGGRVLVRASGTEPAVRVMVEADSAEQAAAAVDQIVSVVVSELG